MLHRRHRNMRAVGWRVRLLGSGEGRGAPCSCAHVCSQLIEAVYVVVLGAADVVCRKFRRTFGEPLAPISALSRQRSSQLRDSIRKPSRIPQ
eukprot:COSAG02_NODE_148_length_33809_cov_158.369594_26_plen_92_part_00